MKIIRADKMGFCAGVRRAVSLADSALSSNHCGQVYTFGPLIHNPVALKNFARRGLKILTEDKISSLAKDDTVVIRAHGVPPETEEALRATGAAVIDGTCPIVQANQKKCSEYTKNGYVIFFTGDAHHGEVVGIEGAARRCAELSGRKLDFILVKTVDEAVKSCSRFLADGGELKSVLLSQTTFSVKLFDEIAAALKQRLPSIEVVRTICPATYERQDSLDALCSKVDGVLVIGGKNSANTNRLYQKAMSLCPRAALIEDAQEIPRDFFSLEAIGLTAGASTPDDVVDGVENALRSMSETSL